MAVVGSIWAKLQADASGLVGGLSLGATKVTAYERHVGASLSRIDRRWSKTTGIIGAQSLALAGRFGAMIAPLLSASLAINGTKAALEKFGKVADDSAASALDAELFQSLAHQAELGGVAYDQFSAALGAFAKNSGLAVAGKGRMAASLKALNPELLKSIQLAGSQEQRVKLLADALSKESDASKRAAISTAAFGEAGLKLATVFAGGSAEIDAMMIKAQGLGIIVSRDLIARADELGDEFDTLTKILDTQTKQALVNLAPILTGLVGLAGDFATSLNIVLDQFNAVEKRKFLKPLQNELAELHNRRFPLGDEIEKLKESLESLPDGNLSKGFLGIELEQKQAQFEAMTAEAVRLLDRITELQGRGSTPLTLPTPTTVELPDDIATREDAAKAAIKQGEAVKALIADLAHERDMIGKSAVEQRVATELRKAGTAATAEQQAQIISSVTAIEAETAAIESLNAIAEFSKGTPHGRHSIRNSHRRTDRGRHHPPG